MYDQLFKSLLYKQLGYLQYKKDVSSYGTKYFYDHTEHVLFKITQKDYFLNNENPKPLFIKHMILSPHNCFKNNYNSYSYLFAFTIQPNLERNKLFIASTRLIRETSKNTKKSILE